MPRKKFLSNLYLQLSTHLLDAKKILCTTHVNPDADGIGSVAALCIGLSELGKEATLVLENDLHKKYSHLVREIECVSLDSKTMDAEDLAEYDLIIVADTNQVSRVGTNLSQKIISHKNIIFIDHHPFEDLNSDKHYIDSRASATGEMVGHLLDQLGITFTKPIAMALYTAILIDTNVFRYPSVTADTHRLIAKLLDTGLTVTEAYNVFHGSKKVHHMHLLGHILKNAKINHSGLIAWIWISEADLREYQSEIEDTHAYINNLLSLDGVRIACMFREDGNKVKVSLRSHGDYDVSTVAQKLGGGGHAHSAAANLEMIKGKSNEDICLECIKVLEDFLRLEDAS